MSKMLLSGKRVEIEVAGIPFGDQIAVEWLPLVGVVYDPQDDVLQVIVEGHVDHMIHDVREIYIVEAGAGLESMLVKKAAAAPQIPTFRNPLMRPAPAEALH